MKTLIDKDLDKFTTTKLLMRKEAKDFYEAKRHLNQETEVDGRSIWNLPLHHLHSSTTAAFDSGNPVSGNPVSFQS